MASPGKELALKQGHGGSNCEVTHPHTCVRQGIKHRINYSLSMTDSLGAAVTSPAHGFSGCPVFVLRSQKSRWPYSSPRSTSCRNGISAVCLLQRGQKSTCRNVTEGLEPMAVTLPTAGRSPSREPALFQS